MTRDRQDPRHLADPGADPPARRDAAEVTVEGRLDDTDLKQLSRLARATHVGPVTTYYAGVTAPIVSAGVAVTTRAVLLSVGVSTLWALLAAGLLAATAGIVWFLIFMRWSYRQHFAADTRLDPRLSITVDEDGIRMCRGPVTLHVGWPAVRRIRRTRRHTAILFDGTDPVIVPHDWFDDRAARQAFWKRLERRGDDPHGKAQAV